MEGYSNWKKKNKTVDCNFNREKRILEGTRYVWEDHKFEEP